MRHFIAVGRTHTRLPLRRWSSLLSGAIAASHSHFVRLPHARASRAASAELGRKFISV